VIELVGTGPQAGLDIAQTLPVSELRKGQAQELIPARKGAEARIAAVSSHTPAKLPVGQKGDELREDGTAQVHALLSAATMGPFLTEWKFKSRQAKTVVKLLHR
jgi:hypothetical protein